MILFLTCERCSPFSLCRLHSWVLILVLFFVFFCFPFCLFLFLVLFFPLLLPPAIFSFHISPGCLAAPPPAAVAAGDDVSHHAPQPPPLPPSFSQALLRSPLPSLPYLFSPSCVSYSLLSATLGSSRGIVMPATSATGFSPIMATPAPVKSDVPLVQDAAGKLFYTLSHG